MSKIVICDPNPEWENEFKSIAKRIRFYIDTKGIRIDHIGSTSVLNLSAKDIIDIQITVKDIEDSSIIFILKKAGYQFRQGINYDNLIGHSDDSQGLKKRYFREKTGERITHIHIREEGRLNQIYPLVFRDFLRSNAAVREAYSIIKKELAIRFKDDINAYYSIKDPHMDTIFEAAKLWSINNYWKPDNKFI